MIFGQKIIVEGKISQQVTVNSYSIDLNSF